MPMPLQGATAPGSRLATLLTANVETIGTLCLVQAAAPGTPVMYAPVVATMDPRTGLYAAGAMEHAVLCVAATEMARWYGLPAESSGLCTQTYQPDLQTAWEKTGGGLLVTLSDPDVLVGPGLLGGATVLNLEQILLDVEVIRHARRARSGVPVRDDLWLDDVLERVGPSGSFLGERSTRTGVHAGEWRLSDFGVQGSWDAWQAAGAPGSMTAARERIAAILSQQVSLSYSDDQAAPLAALQRAPTPPLTAARQRAQRVESEAGQQLGVEVGGLLRHDLAAVGDGPHAVGRRGVEEGPEPVSAGAQGGERAAHAVGVVHMCLGVVVPHAQRVSEQELVEQAHREAGGDGREPAGGEPLRRLRLPCTDEEACLPVGQVEAEGADRVGPGRQRLERRPAGVDPDDRLPDQVEVRSDPLKQRIRRQ